MITRTLLFYRYPLRHPLWLQTSRSWWVAWCTCATASRTPPTAPCWDQPVGGDLQHIHPGRLRSAGPLSGVAPQREVGPPGCPGLTRALFKQCVYWISIMTTLENNWFRKENDRRWIDIVSRCFPCVNRAMVSLVHHGPVQAWTTSGFYNRFWNLSTRKYESVYPNGTRRSKQVACLHIVAVYEWSPLDMRTQEQVCNTIMFSRTCVPVNVALDSAANQV